MRTILTDFAVLANHRHLTAEVVRQARKLTAYSLERKSPMAKRKKKALSQKVVNVATSGMPSPIRKFAGNRFIALLVVLTLPVLYATGVVSFEWRNGRPSMSFNRQRAAEVKANAAEKIQDLRGQQEQGQAGPLGIVSDWEGATLPRVSINRQQEEGLEARVAERVEEVRGYVGEDRGQGIVTPTTNGYEAPSSQGVRPLARLKQLLDPRR